MKKLRLIFIGLLFLGTEVSAWGHTLELFAKASVSKNHLSSDTHVISVSGATGLAFAIFSQVRIEGRFTVVSQLQNKMVIDGSGFTATLNDIKTETNIYSVGIDVDLLGDKHEFQPFIYIGAGYVETSRSYYLSFNSASATLESDPTRRNISANLGAGFRFNIAKSARFEVEAFAYGLDPHKPNPLINLYGTAGIRLFI